jgi:hypothetical protein
MGSHPGEDFGFGRLTGWVWVPNNASRNATSSFEPTWIMTCLLFAPLVGVRARRVQDDLVSGMFQACFVAVVLPSAISRQRRRSAIIFSKPWDAPHVMRQIESIVRDQVRSELLAGCSTCRHNSALRLD